MAPQREWFEKDYYRVLGVDPKASDREITKAYRGLARENHPDANPGDVRAEERFKEASAAYDVVGDPERRQEYDEVRRLGPMAGGAGGGFDPRGFGDLGDLGDLGGLFGNLFGRGRGSTPGPGTGPQRGDDLEADLHLSFHEAIDGVTTAVNLVSEGQCRTCSGTGARPGTRPSTCDLCGGRGVLDDNQGLFSFSQPCGACGGRGQIVHDPCETCLGTGAERRPRELKVRIPAGVDDGQRIRLKGRGAPGRHGGPRGDLYVRVHVEADELFGRRGTDLTLLVPITYPEAVLGCDIRIPTLDGRPVTLRVPSGTASGRTFRVRGRGVETAKKTGDLLVTVEITVPKNVTDRERAALQSLVEATEGSPRAYLGEKM